MNDMFVALDREEKHWGAVLVDIARKQMRAIIDLFIEQAVRFHETPAPPAGVIDPDYEPALHAALKLTTGGGKSEQMRQGVAKFVQEQKRRGHRLYRVIFLVPTHRLAEEASNKLLAVFGALGISTTIYQSREAKDLNTGEPLCRNLEAVKAAQSIGADVHKTCCEDGKSKCRFFDGCAFQLQRAKANMADVVFAAHELLFTTLNRFGKDTFGLVIIDEGFSLKGIIQDPRQTRMKIGEICDASLATHPVRQKGEAVSNEETRQLRDLSSKLQSALMQMPDGRVTRQALIDVGNLNISYSEAAKLEFKRMVKVALRPDTSAEERYRLIEQYKYMRPIRRRARMWKALEEFRNGDQEIAGRLIIETVIEAGVANRYLRVLGKKDIHETFTALPLLHGDATMEIDMVRHHLPYLTMLQEINVLAPHERITQIVGLSVGKKILALPDKATHLDAFVKQQGRRDRLRALVIHLARGRRTLVISQKHVEDVFQNIPNVDTAHFGAIEGLDKYGTVEVLITIGRPMPSPSAIEISGSALTGNAVTVGKRVKQHRVIQFKDGTERLLPCNGYENEAANLISRAIAEGGVLQALGRSRAVNRTPETPVEAFVILDDLTLPIPIDALVHVADVEPNEIDEMMSRGLVPEWPADAARLYPDLFKDRKAADYRYRRDGRVSEMFAAASYSAIGLTSSAGSYSAIGLTSARGEPNHAIDLYSYSGFGLTSNLCRFKPNGRGQRARRALLSAEVAPGVRARIEGALGELAAFELMPGEGEQPSESRRLFSSPVDVLAARQGNRSDGGA
ncbi:DEAD/DEAH box helicase family protein [Bradyrhizobium sp. AUGA SZCCT0160]|uniref:DEAD/DEAH box helicase family protein n=1 Tax=Bradyrhizobium sp. AUGA SZCCT0160 TaxID=2807662 RepID=UPI001BA6DC10|nr:DEAD/DEAH box helicase family protein [Bradyrhizobium sp. AUGA SZCCT0160]MBR1187302.1 DEAD/DEAH box helicase family protein [Bradyrhizobium sp. AUGA SZCCT0160]